MEAAVGRRLFGEPSPAPPVVAEVEDQHVLGVLQLAGALRQLVVAQVLGEQSRRHAPCWGGSPPCPTATTQPQDTEHPGDHATAALQPRCGPQRARGAVEGWEQDRELLSAGVSPGEGQCGGSAPTSTERSSSWKMSSGTPEFFRLLARATMALEGERGVAAATRRPQQGRGWVLCAPSAGGWLGGAWGRRGHLPAGRAGRRARRGAW